jgi:hypothetical protein
VRFDPTTAKSDGRTVSGASPAPVPSKPLDFGDVADIGLSLAGKTLMLAVREIQANIWLAERKPPQPPR